MFIVYICGEFWQIFHEVQRKYVLFWLGEMVVLVDMSISKNRVDVFYYQCGRVKISFKLYFCLFRKVSNLVHGG